MKNDAALQRIKVGVPATVEHSSEAGPETPKWVAETTQVSAFGSTLSSLVYHALRTLPRLPSAGGCIPATHLA
jgi:hypothetical protein